MMITHEELLKRINEVANANGLPQGKIIEKMYNAAESGNLRAIVAGNRYEMQSDETWVWKK